MSSIPRSFFYGHFQQLEIPQGPVLINAQLRGYVGMHISGFGPKVTVIGGVLEGKHAGLVMENASNNTFRGASIRKLEEDG
jgi:hypothetical protein